MWFVKNDSIRFYVFFSFYGIKLKLNWVVKSTRWELITYQIGSIRVSERERERADLASQNHHVAIDSERAMLFS